MQGRRLTGVEVVVLELIDGLGGEAHSAHLAELILEPLRPFLKRALLDLFDKGLLLRYAPGHYYLTPEGRSALAEELSSSRTG